MTFQSFNDIVGYVLIMKKGENMAKEQQKIFWKVVLRNRLSCLHSWRPKKFFLVKSYKKGTIVTAAPYTPGLAVFRSEAQAIAWAKGFFLTSFSSPQSAPCKIIKVKALRFSHSKKPFFSLLHPISTPKDYKFCLNNTITRNRWGHPEGTVLLRKLEVLT